MTTPQRTFSCLIRGRFPDRFCSPVQQHRLFFPLSTRTYQAHAEGRGCLPFTREAGVVAIPLPQYHLPAWICSYENQYDFRRSASTLTGGFERTGRTQSMQPKSGNQCVLQAFYWLRLCSAELALSRPAHQRVMQTVDSTQSELRFSFLWVEFYSPDLLHNPTGDCCHITPMTSQPQPFLYVFPCPRAGENHILYPHLKRRALRRFWLSYRGTLP